VFFLDCFFHNNPDIYKAQPKLEGSLVKTKTALELEACYKKTQLWSRSYFILTRAPQPWYK